MPQVAIDTPDYQQGVVSAQALLASVAGGEASATTGIPPNAETVVVAVSGADIVNTVQVTGLTSGLDYPVVMIPNTRLADYQYCFFVDATSVFDEEVQFTLIPTPINPWYVYADGAAHIVADASKLTNHQGVQYVIPTIPNVTAGDHPPNELQNASGGWSANATLIPAPGAGARIRLFSGTFAALDSNCWGALNDTNAGKALAIVTGPNTVPIVIPAQGYPMGTDDALNFAIGSGAGTFIASVYYTIEAV